MNVMLNAKKIAVKVNGTNWKIVFDWFIKIGVKVGGGWGNYYINANVDEYLFYNDRLDVLDISNIQCILLKEKFILSFEEWKEQTKEKYVIWKGQNCTCFDRDGQYKILDEKNMGTHIELKIADKQGGEMWWTKSCFELEVNIPDVFFTEVEKKIIGYKSPYALFRGDNEIPKGSIFKMITTFSYKDAGTTNNQFSRHLPKEIVETWEPVYEPPKPEFEIIEIGASKRKVKISKGKMEIDVCTGWKETGIISWEAIQSQVEKMNSFKLAGMNISTMLKIANLNFTAEDGKKVIDAYKKFNQ